MEINNLMSESTEDPCLPEKCHDTVAVSRYKNVASQCFATLATNIVMFSSGSFFGLTTILIPKLDGENREILMTDSEVTWFSSYLFLQPIGAIIIGLVARWIGSRWTMILGSLLFILSLVIFYYATTPAMFLLAQGIVALSSVTGPGITYTTEITQPHLRSVIMATTNFSSILGALFTTIFASFLHWRMVTLANLVFAVLGFFALFFIPNSPHWLVTKRRFEEAELALAWLRGWTTPDEVSSEFQIMKQSIPSSTAHLPLHEAHDVTLPHDRLWNNIKLYLNRSFLLPMISICYIFIVRAAMGTLVIEIFSEHIFEKINTPQKEYFTIAVYSVDILGSVFYMLNVNRIGKRSLMFISLFEAGLAYFVIAIFVYLTMEKLLIDEIYLYIAPSIMLFSIFATTSGIDTIVNMLNGELFPTRHRDVGAGIGMFMNTASASVMQKIFLYMENAFSVPGVFLFFSIMTFFGLITFYFIIPETEGKTLLEIEHHYTNFKIMKRLRRKNFKCEGNKNSKLEAENPMTPK